MFLKNTKKAISLVSLMAVAIVGSVTVINTPTSSAGINAEHEYAKITRDRVKAALAVTGSKKEIKLAEASLTGLGWLVIYGNDDKSAAWAALMNDIVFKAYNGTDKMNVILMNHTSEAYAEMLNLNRFEKRKADNPSDEYSKIVQSRLDKVFAPGAGYAEFKSAEGSLAALGWMTLFGNDANSKALATQLMNKAFSEWRGANEVYTLQSSEAYAEMTNLGRFKLNTAGSAQTSQVDPVEEQYWDAVKNSTRTQDFQSYLSTYPNGKYASIARSKMSPQTTGNVQLTNLALGRTATQSGDMGSPFKATDGVASKAVDGNTDGNFRNGSVTHTACGVDAGNNCQGSKNPWWKVDLGAEYEISKIEIWNRTDCCEERLSNFKVWVSPTTGEWIDFSKQTHTYKAGEKYPLTVLGKQKARCVVILMENPNGFLSLAEVKVFGSN